MLEVVPGLDANYNTEPHLAKENLQCGPRLAERAFYYMSENNIKKQCAALIHGSINGKALNMAYRF